MENKSKSRMKMDELNTNFEIYIQSSLISANLNKIEEVDLLFIPLLQENHYYLFCANFKKPSIIIVDNMKGKLKGKQNTHVKMMRDVLVMYLEKHAPALGKRMKNEFPTKVEMPWQTKKNFVDCGIFAMRHMETYLGKPITEWAIDCKISEEKDGRQKDEMNDLRIKYMTKILLADINVLHAEVITKIKEFEKIDPSEREKLKVKAHKRIVERKKEKVVVG